MTALAAERVGVVLNGARVVDGLGLTLEEGGWLGLIGPNGAGKTTFLRAVAGLVPYEGSISLGGDEVRDEVRVLGDPLGFGHWHRRHGRGVGTRHGVLIEGSVPCALPVSRRGTGSPRDGLRQARAVAELIPRLRLPARQ